jgi:hypothetical protein
MVSIVIVLAYNNIIPLALRYSVLCNSSIVSKASASSLAKACSSSYSPGLPMRSSIILPRFVYLKKKKIASTSTAIPAEPKADKMPIKIPLPVDPALILITTDDGAMLPGCSADCCPRLWLLAVDETDKIVLDEGESSVGFERVEGEVEGSKEKGASGFIAASFFIAHAIAGKRRRSEGSE